MLAIIVGVYIYLFIATICLFAAKASTGSMKLVVEDPAQKKRIILMKEVSISCIIMYNIIIGGIV